MGHLNGVKKSFQGRQKKLKKKKKSEVIIFKPVRIGRFLKMKKKMNCENCEMGKIAPLETLRFKETGIFVILEPGCGNLHECKFEVLCFT